MSEANNAGKLNRRNFLKFSSAGTTLLVGNAFLSGRGLNKSIVQPPKNSVNITTHEWFGDIEERLDFPENWMINAIEMDGHNAPVLTPEEIKQKISSPVQTKLLRDIAYGKKTAAIVFDDITRPTPVSEIAPFIIEELKKGGIKDENILFIAALGTHGTMSQIEARAKLGTEIVEKYPWINHNIWENVVDVGRTSFRNRIKVNYFFINADIKVCISGIKQHPDAGYGGGGKAILPGIAGIESIAYNHGTIAGMFSRRNETQGTCKVFKNEVRLDMEEAAKLAEVDFTVQVVYNQKRKPVGVFAGESRQAHLEASKMANRHYRTPVMKDADIVIANTYPLVQQGPEYTRALINESVKEGGSVVLISQNPMGRGTMHFLNERNSFRNMSYWDMLPTFSPVPKAGHIIVFSQYFQKRDMDKFSAKHVQYAKTWEQVLVLLRKNHNEDTTVAIYPYATIQHPPIELDDKA